MSGSAKIPVRRHGTNVVHTPSVTLRFQRFPGARGPVGERAIAGLPCSLEVGGRVTTGLQTTSRGDLRVSVPPGTAEFTVRILGGEYRVQVEGRASVGELTRTRMRDAKDGDVEPGFRAMRRRLELLGYGDPTPVGPEDTMDRELDEAVLRFQIDEGLRPDGIVGPLTRARLNRRTGP